MKTELKYYWKPISDERFIIKEWQEQKWEEYAKNDLINKNFHWHFNSQPNPHDKQTIVGEENLHNPQKKSIENELAENELTSALNEMWSIQAQQGEHEWEPYIEKKSIPEDKWTIKEYIDNNYKKIKAAESKTDQINLDRLVEKRMTTDAINAKKKKKPQSPTADNLTIQQQLYQGKEEFFESVNTKIPSQKDQPTPPLQTPNYPGQDDYYREPYQGQNREKNQNPEQYQTTSYEEYQKTYCPTTEQNQEQHQQQNYNNHILYQIQNYYYLEQNQEQNYYYLIQNPEQNYYYLIQNPEQNYYYLIQNPEQNYYYLIQNPEQPPQTKQKNKLLNKVKNTLRGLPKSIKERLKKKTSKQKHHNHQGFN